MRSESLASRLFEIMKKPSFSNGVYTTLEIARMLNTVAPATCVADVRKLILKKGLPCHIERIDYGLNENGRQVHAYRLINDEEVEKC